MTMTRCLLVLSTFVGAASVCRAQNPGSDSEAKVAKLMQAWENYRQSLPVLRYRYTQDRTILASPDFAITKDLKSSEERDLTMEWKSGRYRLVSTQPKDIGKPELHRSTSTFDRKKMYGINEPLLPTKAPDPAQPPTGGTMEGHLTSYKAQELGAQPPMISVGHAPIGAVRGEYTAAMFPSDPREMLYFSRNERVGGLSCEVFSTFPVGSKDEEKVYELSVDPAHDCCVVRFVTFVSRRPMMIFDFKYGMQSGYWLPTSWTAQVYMAGKLHTTLKADPVRIEPVPDADDSLFVLKFPEGMTVTRDIVADTKGRMVTTDDVKTTPAVVENGAVVVPSERRWAWLTTRGLPILAGVLALAAGLYLIRRRRRRTSPLGESR